MKKAAVLLVVAVLLAVEVVANAQQPVKKLPGIGFLSTGAASNQSLSLSRFETGCINSVM